MILSLLLALHVSSLPLLAADDSTSSRGGAGKPTIAVFSLTGPITETPTDEGLPLLTPLGTSLRELADRIKRAGDDPDVRAVVLLPESVWLGQAQVEELRQVLSQVRSHGKEVYAHADSLMTADYALACGASRISVVPTGLLLVPGLHASTMYLRGLLDKIGVQPDFMTEGAYKSAAELFMRDQPSPEADEMMNWLMNSWYDSLTRLIATGRRVEASKARSWLDAGVFTAEKAKAAGLIDAVEQTEDFEAMLKKRYGRNTVFDKKYGRKAPPSLDFSSPFAFFKIWMDLLSGLQKKGAAKPAVGIVYVDGPIMTGKSQPVPFGGNLGAFSTDLRRALDKAADDDSIKAVVLRIDSPGGSATASEIILDSTKRLKAKKPFVVSMGAVAGSGGYYVACGADTIFADAATLTGSIGVLTGKLATTDMWKKMGITFREYKRGQNAGILSTDAPFTESERSQMRAFMDDVYGVFKDHVRQIRGNKLKKPLDEIAGGRVYTGKQALELGLVDRLGTLEDAIAFAANQVNLSQYDVRVVPEPKNFLEQLIEATSGENNDGGHIDAAASDPSLIRLALPYLQNLDPRRTAAVLSALRRLQVLQIEGVALSMPEIIAQ